MARARKTPLEEIVYGLRRLGGLRCAEITGLRRWQIALGDDLLHVHGTKSAESVRSVVVFPEHAEIIERWLAFQDARRVFSAQSLFVTSAGGASLSEAYVWRCVKRVAARAGIRLHGVDANGRPLALDRAGENVSRVCPRTLRRTFGSDLLNRGVRIEVVSAQLGHSSVKITEKAYAKLRTQTQRMCIMPPAHAQHFGCGGAGPRQTLCERRLSDHVVPDRLHLQPGAPLPAPTYQRPVESLSR